MWDHKGDLNQIIGELEQLPLELENLGQLRALLSDIDPNRAALSDQALKEEYENVIREESQGKIKMRGDISGCWKITNNAQEERKLNDRITRVNLYTRSPNKPYMPKKRSKQGLIDRWKSLGRV